MSRTARGRRGEDLACDHLRSLGYTIVARNVRTVAGEIDVVAERGATLVFVEVRSKSGSRFGTGLESVDRRKRARVARAAAAYLARGGFGERSARFDVIGIDWRKDGEPTIDHIESAFELGG